MEVVGVGSQLRLDHPLYMRQSIDRTGEGLAVNRQREANVNFARARGWNSRGGVCRELDHRDQRHPVPGFEYRMQLVDRLRLPLQSSPSPFV